jgi:signal transduction histidine kinase
VLTRHLLFKLLAPTVLVSLLLVATCSAGVLYLNQLHVAISGALTENVESTLAADRLDRTITELFHHLRDRTTNHMGRTLANQLREEITWADQQLQDIGRLANLDQERQHADQIAAGLQFYQELWKERVNQPPDQLKVFDLELAHRLEDREKGALPACRALRRYNTDQVKAADRENSLLVSRLTWALLAVGVGAPLSGLLLGYATARSLYQSIYQLSVRIRDAAGRLKGELHPVTLEDLGHPDDLHHQMQGVIHEIERVVEQLQQREREVLRAEQLAAVGQVAAGVAHELRNPLTSVKMLVQAGLEGPEPAGVPLEDLGIIEHEVRRMEGCIQTFLDFARPPASERRRTDLLAVVRRALALLEGRARRQKVALTVDLPPGPVELSIDPEQIHQVLLNLLLNALDALPRGGEVRLEVHGPTPAAQAVTVRIRDTGPGIAARIHERLFEPFVSSKETGLGLGLSICRRLIEAHGGTIQGNNAPEKGAVFEFTLPVAVANRGDGQKN